MSVKKVSVLAVLAWVTAMGCSDATPAPARQSEAVGEAATACPAGMRPAGKACEAILAASCAPNTMATFGSEACTPVGIASCPDGWRRDAGGHGCEPVVATTTCPAGTRAAIGQSECVPVGDCAAAFPPPGATHVVDGSEAPGHYATLGAAVAAAPDGAVIAVGAVTLHENVIVEKPLTIVGKCPAETVLDVATSKRLPAISVAVSGTVEVRNLSIRNQLAGALDVVDGELAARDVVFADNSGFALHAGYGARGTLERVLAKNTKRRGPTLYGAAVTVETGASVTVRDAAIVGVEGPGLAVTGKKSVLEADRVIVSGVRGFAQSDEGFTSAVLVRSDAQATLTESLVREVDGMGISAADGGVVNIVRSRIDHVRAKSDDLGVSVYVVGGGKARLEGSTIANVELIGAYVEDEGSSLDVDASAILGPADTSTVRIGRGAVVTGKGAARLRGSVLADLSSAGISFDDARGSLERTLVRGTRSIEWPYPDRMWGGWGVLVETSSVVSLDRVTIETATLSGIGSTQGASIEGRDVVVRDTRGLLGEGVGSCIQAGVEAKLVLDGAALLGCVGTAAIAGRGSHVTLRRAILADTLEDGGFAHGITVHELSIADLEDVYIARNPGIGLAANGAGASMRRGALVDNAVAVHAQAGSYVRESDEEGALEPGELRVATTTKVIGNAQKIGSGIVPLPGGD